MGSAQVVYQVHITTNPTSEALSNIFIDVEVNLANVSVPRANETEFHCGSTPATAPATGFATVECEVPMTGDSILIQKNSTSEALVLKYVEVSILQPQTISKTVFHTKTMNKS